MCVGGALPRLPLAMRRLLPPCLALWVAVLAVAGCSLPPEGEGAARRPAGAPGLADGGTADTLIQAVQLHVAGDEASLPVYTLGAREPLRLAFDWLVEGTGRPLSITFTHTDRDGRETLLPTEFLTGFERDDITDYRVSGLTGLSYVHYEYTLPNPRIGFRVSGRYRLDVDDGGRRLFSRIFFVAEREAEVELGFGTTLAGGLAGPVVQPAARVAPGPRLSGFDAFQYTVCFTRNGRLDDTRCAPEPTAIDFAFFQYYLRREAAFGLADPLFDLDLGLLALGPQVVELDPARIPPAAVLDLDYAEFGGRVTEPVIATAPIISAAFRDVGDARTDARYVDVRFRYVPPGGRQSARPVHVLGGFNGWQPSAASRMTWRPEEGRYERTLRIKQGRYVYGYVAAGGPPRAGVALGQPSVYTAFVYLRDPSRFTDRLVAVQSGVAR